MIPSSDPRWDEWCGGYGLVADLPGLLDDLQKGALAYEDLWQFVWDEMHHQGDVGAASYALFPYLASHQREHGEYWINILQYAAVLALPTRRHDQVPEEVMKQFETLLDTLLQEGVLREFNSDDERMLLFAVIAARQKARSLVDFIRYFLGTDIEDYLKKQGG